MNLSSSSVMLGEYENPEEYEYDLGEPEFAGITASWLRKTITILSQIAELNSFKKYKSAVKIQAYYRGWIRRKKIQKLHEAATKIQKTWRGFQGRILFFLPLEEAVQQGIVEYHNRSAIIIQAAFRGFYSRKYRHDHMKLHRLRLKATTELLKNVALETRHLTKAHLLPGVFSLLNTKCIKNVDQIFNLLNVKRYNEKVRNEQAAKENKIREAYKKSMHAKKLIPVPFGTCKLGKQ